MKKPKPSTRYACFFSVATRLEHYSISIFHISISDWQPESDLDSIRNSCDVFMICLFCMNSLLEGFVRRYPTRIPMAKCTTATGRLPSSTSSCRLSSNCGNHLDCSPALFNAIAPPSPLMTGINSKCKKDNLRTIRFLFCQILYCFTWWNGMGSSGHWYLREMDPPTLTPCICLCIFLSCL